VTIGDGPVAGQLPSPPQISPLIAGQWHIVTTPWGRGKWLPRVYDARGDFLAEVGRAGSGPREYQAAEMVFATGDTAMIHDVSLRRMSFLLPPDSLLRSVPWPERPFSLLELRDGSFVLTNGDFAPGAPLLHVARDGTVLQAFGEPQSGAVSNHRLLAAAPDGSFWSARSQQRLELQQWRAPGDLVTTLTLDSDWFVPYEKDPPPSLEQPPSPALIAIWTDQDGLLWLVGMAADERWQRGYSAPRDDGDGHQYARVDDPDIVFDAIIEVWDPVSRTRQWSERLDRIYSVQLGPWLMGATQERGDGHVVAEVVRVVPR
jgi:hypothetical protein